MSDTDRTVVHAYGIVYPGTPVPEADGIGDAAVELVTIGPIAALVSRLSDAEYGADVWRAHAEDPRWLGGVAEAHHRVLQAVVGTADVLPLRLPSIHPDLAALKASLAERTDVLSAAMGRIRGHIELGAKAFVVSGPREDGAPTGKVSGREYLARRKAQADLRESARSRRQARLVDAHHTMAAAAADSTTSPPQDPALSGRAEPMVLNAAYLVARDRLDDLVAVAERVGEDLHGDGIALEVTGPWPPYNFVEGRAEPVDAGAPDGVQ